MKQVLLAAAALMMSIGASAAGLGDIKTVYLLPMSNGLDQYLAVRLTTGAILQVVTDPQKADAVLTDHVGEGFEESLNELYGAKPKTDDSAGDSGQSFTRVGTHGHVRGALFLVDRKTRDVVWSAYERPKNTTPDGLKQAADRLADKLAKAAKPK
jgi:hypothetical protein